MSGPGVLKPIASLLGRVGLRSSGGEARPAVTGHAGALRGGEAVDAGPLKGAPIGPDGQLQAGIGYATGDRHAAARNVAEKANVERFLAEHHADRPAPRGERPREGQAFTRAGAGRGEARDARDGRADEPRREGEERRLDEGPREPQVLDGGRAEAEAHDPRADREPHADREGKGEGEGGHGGGGSKEGDEDEDDRPGGGWVLEEAEEAERRRAFRVEGADPSGAASRCRGLLEDGRPCLRKPLAGMAYCRVHRFS